MTVTICFGGGYFWNRILEELVSEVVWLENLKDRNVLEVGNMLSQKKWGCGADWTLVPLYSFLVILFFEDGYIHLFFLVFLVNGTSPSSHNLSKMVENVFMMTAAGVPLGTLCPVSWTFYLQFIRQSISSLFSGNSFFSLTSNKHMRGLGTNFVNKDLGKECV